MRRTSGAILVALLLLTASCAADSPEPGQPGAVDGPGVDEGERSGLSLEEAQLAYARCMRDRGLDWPDPDADGDTVLGPEVDLDSPAFIDADQECSAVYDRVDDLSVPAEPIDPGWHDEQLAFAACMRDHGVDYPDPNVDGQAGSGHVVAVENEEAFDAALAACRERGSSFEDEGSGGDEGSAP
jgi:hypothetical protein